MNRYTTEDFEELGNIAAEICCEKKFNPFAFKKFAKKGSKKDDDDDVKSKGKPKSKEKAKKDKNEKVDEGYLVEFEENQGIPWEPINEMSEMERQYMGDDIEEEGEEDEDDTGDEYTRMALGDYPRDNEESDDNEKNAGEEEMLPGNVGETEGGEIETNPSEDEPMITNNPYDADSDDFGGDSDYEPIRSTGRGKTSLDDAMNAASDDSQADENGEGAPIGTDEVKYPVTLKFADGFEETYDDEDGENGFSYDEIVDNLKSEHSGEDGDSRIVEINGEPADEWAARHGITDIIPPEEHEFEDGSDIDDTTKNIEPEIPASPSDEEDADLDAYSF